MILSGELRDRVEFYAPTAADDGYGNTTSGFASTPAFSSVAAQIVPKLGGETVQAQRLAGKNLVNITVRRSAQTVTVTASWKVRDVRAGIEYNIRSIIDPDQGGVQRGAWLEMLCERGVAL